MNTPVLAIQNFSEPLDSAQRLLVVGEQKRSGLILCKPHYAQFAGPGAAICSACGQHEYETIIAIGSPEIVEVSTYVDRQKAYGRRIQWVRWLQKIVTQPSATGRAEKLLAGFEEFFGGESLNSISDEALSLLAGVLPSTIAALRSPRGGRGKENYSSPAASEGLEVNVITLDAKVLQLEPCVVPIHKNLKPLVDAIPCSA